MKELFPKDATIEQKKEAIELIAGLQNITITLNVEGGCAFAFSMAKALAEAGEADMATYFLTLCTDPNEEEEED